MKRVYAAFKAFNAAAIALSHRAAEQYREIRDLASGGPSIEVCPDCMRAYNPKPFGRCEHCQRETAPPMPPVAHAGGSSQALANRIRSILGPRNDDSRTVVDLIDELCEELDRREPSVICGCGAFNGRARTSCYECGQALPPSEPVRDRQLDRMNGPRFTARQNRGPCGLCDGVGIVDIGFGRTDTCGGCKGTGRVEA